MMRKMIFTILTACFVPVFSAGAVEYNLFDAADVDANGWIWFDTQAKIDRYIGQADNENAKYSEPGKPIQLISADFGEYLDSEASHLFVGAGTDGKPGGAGAKTGAIRISPASASMSTSGGGFVVKMPSCTSFNIMLSSGSKVYVRLLGTADAGKLFSDYTIVSAKYSTVFSALTSAGQKTWTDMHKLNNGNEPFFAYESPGTMYARYQNLTKDSIYIHGMKILTSTPATGIDHVNAGQFRFDGKTVFAGETAGITVYNLQGTVEKSEYASALDVSDLEKGAYLVKISCAERSYTKKIIIK
jgi:hypothetical protein